MLTPQRQVPFAEVEALLRDPGPVRAKSQRQNFAKFDQYDKRCQILAKFGHTLAKFSPDVG